MVTLLDLVQQNGFREFVKNRIAQGSGNQQYQFPEAFPKLYRYRALSSYAVNDIIESKITLTRVGEFNDLFDGAIHQYGTIAERKASAEEEWVRISPFMWPESHDRFIEDQMVHYNRDAKLKFRLLDYLGVHVGCLSAQNNSTLMWSHYADSNTGICIEYDFNQLADDDLRRKLIFPVCYSKTPVFVADLIADKDRKIYEFPLDAAVLCAAINKGQTWSYEDEWRILLPLVDSDGKESRFSIFAGVLPTRILFGYHFLKPFFCRNPRNKGEYATASKKILEAHRLLEYMVSNKIEAGIMVPAIGCYTLEPKQIDASLLNNFLSSNFFRSQPGNMSLYYSTHDELMNLLERKDANA